MLSNLLLLHELLFQSEVELILVLKQLCDSNEVIKQLFHVVVLVFFVILCIELKWQGEAKRDHKVENNAILY